MNSRLYIGELMHARLQPVQHAFAYRSVTFVLDLDELRDLDRQVRGFGYNRFSLVSLRDADYLDAGPGSVREKLDRYLRETPGGDTVRRVELVTCLRLLNYVFNPVNFYYAYDAGGALRVVVAEVNNTFSERHVYVLSGPATDPLTGATRFEHQKEFHVSPMNDMRGSYVFRFGALGDEMSIGLDLVREGETLLTAALTGRRRPLTSRGLLTALARRPLALTLTVPRIVWQAARLHFGKRLPVYRRPVPTHARTIVRRPGENEVRPST